MKPIKVDWLIPNEAYRGKVGNYFGYRTLVERMREWLPKVGIEYDPSSQLHLSVCAPAKFQKVPGKTSCLFTMFESPDLYANVVPVIKDADVIMTPSDFCTESFRRYVDCPVVTVPMGVDEIEYRERTVDDVTPDHPFRFLWVGAFNPRKGWPFLSQAWEHHFRKVPYMQLYLKTTSDNPAKQKVHTVGNSVVDGRILSKQELADLYYSSHAAVVPSMGEGWGLTIAESMMSGLPVLTTKYSGHLTFANDKNCNFVKHTVRRVPSDGVLVSAAPDGLFDFAHVDSNDLALSMARLMNDYHNATVTARRAAKDIRKFTWEKMALGIRAVLEEAYK